MDIDKRGFKSIKKADQLEAAINNLCKVKGA